MINRRNLLLILGWLVIASGCLSTLAADDIKKGTPEAPKNSEVLSGEYYRGDGTGFNIYLTLKKNGEYSAEWRGCLGTYGEASGKWSLTDKSITLTPSKEKDMMKGHLKGLDVLKFEGKWIFVPVDDRDFYDKHGVSRYSCFQKRTSRTIED